MKDIDRRQEEYEDALFALLIGEAMSTYQEEAEVLEQTADVEIPKDVDERLRKFIATYQPEKSKKPRAHRRSMKQVLRHTAIAAAAAVCITGTAFAAFPDFKIAVYNLCINARDGMMDFNFEADDETTSVQHTSETIAPEDDFVVGWLPEGFYQDGDPLIMEGFITEYSYLSDSMPKEEAELKAFIHISKTMGDATTTSIDTEDCDVRDVMVGDTQAVFTSKRTLDEISLTWQVGEKSELMRIVASGISEDDLIKIAQNIQTTKERTLEK